MRCALLDNMLFQFEMAALLEDSDTGQRGRRGKTEGESGGLGWKKKKKKARGKMVVWNIC